MVVLVIAPTRYNASADSWIAAKASVGNIT